MTPSPVLRLVALVAVLTVSASFVNPALVALAEKASCAPAADGCAPSRSFGACCCGHGAPAVPGADRVQPVPPVTAQASAKTPARPGAEPCRACLAVVRRHGHSSVDLTTLHSKLLL